MTTSIDLEARVLDIFEKWNTADSTSKKIGVQEAFSNLMRDIRASRRSAEEVVIGSLREVTVHQNHYVDKPEQVVIQCRNRATADELVTAIRALQVRHPT